MAERTGTTRWQDEDLFWQTNYGTRPYAASSGRDYTFYQPGYRYGYEAAQRYEGRDWNDLESDLQRSWNSYEHRGDSTWEQVKDAVRDAWDRVTGNRPMHTR